MFLYSFITAAYLYIIYIFIFISKISKQFLMKMHGDFLLYL